MSTAKYIQSKIFFLGNSLMNSNTNGAVSNGFYIPMTVYDNVTQIPKIYALNCNCVPGQKTATIYANINTGAIAEARAGDVVVLWEITNDCVTEATTGQIAYNNIMDIVTVLKTQRGCKFVVCTGIARDGASDAADLLTKIQDCNALIRTNSANFDAVCDLGADAMFNTRSDCANTTNYQDDKIHLRLAGQNNVISLITASITPIL